MNNILKYNEIISCQLKLDLNAKNPKIDYNKLYEAFKVDGLEENTKSTSHANKKFIESIRHAAYPTKKPAILSIEDSTERSSELGNQKEEPKSIPEPEIDTHDVKLYTKKFHPIKKETADDQPIKRRLRRLKSLCMKPPFRRNTEDVSEIHEILATFPLLSNQLEDDLLEMLSNIIQFESHNEPEIPLFGNKAFYIIISGSVRPLCFPFHRSIGESKDKFKSEQNPSIYSLLFAGSCFGTLDEIRSSDINQDNFGIVKEESGVGEDDSKILLFQTESDNCELVYITTSYYRKIYEKYQIQKHADKLTLLKQCGSSFNVWPQQALVQVANILQWTKIPSNTLLCSEGQISDICGFISSGKCYVLRKLSTKEQLANGKTIYKHKQVLIGLLGHGQTFGEVSLLDRSPMKHSILSKEPLKIIQFSQDKLAYLSEDVRLLLRQSCSPYFYDVTQVNFFNIYC